MTRLKPGVLVACILSFAPAGFAFGQDAGSGQPAIPEVSTSATAERSVRPDRATLTLSFSAPGRTPSLAGRAVAARADSIRDALVALGIARDSLVSAGRYSYWRGRIELVMGSRIEEVPDSILRIRFGDRPIPRPQTQTVPDTTYRAHDAIEVRLRDLALVGRVIDIALEHGITQVSSIRYEATDTRAAEEEALREATERARQRAEIIARANGGELGRTLLLSTERAGYVYPHLTLDNLVSAESTGLQEAPPATEVVAPLVRVRATVHGRWEFRERR